MRKDELTVNLMNEIEVSKEEKIETYILEQQIEKEDTGKYKVLMAK